MRYFLAVLLMFSAALPAAETTLPQTATQYVSRIWRTQDGLPENRIRALAQTPDGYLWIATASGLARFDGARFVVYHRLNTNSMADDTIRDLAVSKDGSLWIATQGGGVLHQKNGRFRSYGPADGLTNEFVAAVLEDRSGDVWAATNRGLFRLHKDRFQRVDEPLHLRNIAFFALNQTSEGKVLAGGPEGLFSFENGQLQPYRANDHIAQVYQIKELNDGSLALGTNQGLTILRPGLPRVERTEIPGAIYQDGDGNVWLPTIGHGLLLLGPGHETAFRAPIALPDDSVSAILEDREKNIWVGTDDGLVRMTRPDVGLLNIRNGLADENVASIYGDREGTIWITTVTGLLYTYKDGKLTPSPRPEPKLTGRIRMVFEDHRGAYWYGTNNEGAVRVANGKATRFSIAEGLRNNGIQSFTEDREGNLWVGTTSGISRWDGAKFTNFYVEQGLSYGWIREIVQDLNSDMLIGTARGLNRFHDGHFVRDAAFDQFSRDRVWSIYPDQTGAIWIGTRGSGLARIRDSKVARITTKEGLLSNSVFGVIGDGKGRLWMSGPQGISSASLADLNSLADGHAGPVPVLFYDIGGLASTQMNGGVQRSAWRTPKDELWFPSVRGAVHFMPEDSLRTQHFPVRIESILIDDVPQVPTGEISIGPDRSRLTIEFTAASLRNPERISFRYKLEHFDPQWRAAAGRRSVTYDNLPHGTYKFRVIASDAGGTSEANFSLRAKPHFYQTAWFYAIAVIFVIACATGAFMFQERQARDRYNLRLGERTRIAREMHDTVVQGCVGVSTLIEAAVGSSGSDQDLMMECLDNARVHLRLTLDEARQALSDLRHDSFENGLSGALAELSQSVVRDRELSVVFESEGAPPVLPDAINRTLLLVAREAIRNAIAHSSATLVSIRLAFDSSGLHLDVQDDGRGFEPDSASLAAVGHFGILGMRERIEQIGGVLEIESSPGNGARVTVHLPAVRILSERVRV